MRRSPWGDTEEVRSLFRAAGFGESHIRDHIGEVRFPTARSMLDGLTGAHAPLAGAIAALGEDEREALYREIEQTLATYTDDDGVMFPMRGSLVLARNHHRPLGSPTAVD